MTDYSMESFMQWCDDVTITEEGLFTTKVPLSYAKKASTVENVLSLTNDEWPIIKLEGNLKTEVQKKMTKAKLQKGVAVAGMSLVSIIGGLLTGHIVVADPGYADDAMKKKTKNLQLYSFYNFDGGLYLRHKGVKIV